MHSIKNQRKTQNIVENLQTKAINLLHVFTITQNIKHVEVRVALIFLYKSPKFRATKHVMDNECQVY